MRRDHISQENVVGRGLAVGVLVALSVAALLAGTGLVLELAPARLLVLTERQPVLLSAQASGARPADGAAPDTRAAGGDATGAAVPGSAPEAEDDATAAPDHAHDASVAAASPVASAVAAAAPLSAPNAGAPDASAPGSAVNGAGVASAQGPAPVPEASPAPVARVRPTPGPRGAPRPIADLPIVMYHHVGLLPPNPDAIRRDLTVSPDLFERTLQVLAEQEVETVTLADLAEHFEGGPELPARAVALTFDDGYDDSYEHAFRLLRQYNMVGTFFVTTDFVERPGYLTWAQIAEMAAAGMAIESHSADHADFTRIGPAELRRQLAEPKTYLEEATGQKVRFLAYPAGKYNDAVMAATRAAGYEAAVTVLHGTRHTPALAFELRRVRARGADTVPEIMARLTPPSWNR